MKNLLLLCFWIVFTSSLWSQGPFTVINWINLTDPDYSPDFSENPYAKKSVEAFRLPSSTSIDIPSMDLQDIMDLWLVVGDENFITNPLSIQEDPFDLDEEGNGTFGASFKVCYDDGNLYVLMKYVDKNEITQQPDDSRTFEVMIQTREPDRYEAGFHAATEVYGFNGSNAQYGRFVELGGYKYALNRDGFIESTSNMGQEGNWAQCLGAENIPENKWIVDQEGTAWCILGLNFADNMMYMDDEWGGYTPSNYVGFDPATKNIISFDIFSSTWNSERNINYGWSTNTMDGFELIYYSGYLFFESRLPQPLVNSPVFYCTGESPVPLEATGSNLMWYDQSTGGTGTRVTPVPSTGMPGTFHYYVSQEVENVESPRAMITIVVSDLQAVIKGDTALTCLSEPSFEAGTNYKGGSEITFSWEYEGENFTGATFNPEPITREEVLLLKAETASGCIAESRAGLSLAPFENPIRLLLVGYDTESGKNKLYWEEKQPGLTDTVIILRSQPDESQEVIARQAWDPGVNSFTDLLSEPGKTSYAYEVKGIDECGILSTGNEIFNTLHLDVIQNMNGYIQLLWNKNYGEEVSAYYIRKGLEPEGLAQVSSVYSSLNYWYDFVPLDTVYYQVEARLPDTGNPETGKILSNLFMFGNPQNIIIDTIHIYDTIRIETCGGTYDTLRIQGGVDNPGIFMYNIKVFPNPAHDLLIIDTGSSGIYNKCTLRIFDTNGREVFRNTCDQPVYEIDLRTFGTKGLYYLQFLSPQNVTLDTKIIVLE